MKKMKFVYLVLLALGLPSLSFAGTSRKGMGISVGFGIPFVSQAGLNYEISDMFGVSIGYNSLDLTADTASVKLTMPEFMINYHPFRGSFFLGFGVGQENLIVKATDITQTVEAKIEVTATTGIAKTGWMWGRDDGGFWFGIDYAVIFPSGASRTITAPGVPTTDPTYVDADNAAKKFGETSYGNITLARIGYIF